MEANSKADIEKNFIGDSSVWDLQTNTSTLKIFTESENAKKEDKVAFELFFSNKYAAKHLLKLCM